MRLAGLIVAALLCAGLPLRAQTTVWTENYDNNRTNANLSENILNTSNVNPTQFGKLFSFPVDGQVYAQPLYVPELAFADIGTRNALFVATMHNSVYAFDADGSTGTAPLWQVNFGTPVNPHDFDIPGLPYTDLRDEIGIVSTPVIDTASQTLYVVHYTGTENNYAYYLHALDLTTGAEKFQGPVKIQATVTGAGWGGLDPVTNFQLVFDAGQHLQRPGLLLLNGVVYVAFGSHGDIGPWHGWLMGYQASDLTQQMPTFNTSPSAAGVSIWQGGRGVAADDEGNIYLATGNGTYDGTKAWGESVLRLSPGGTVADWFTPSTWAALNDKDSDFGSNGPVLLPGTNQLLAGGKGGTAVLLDRTNLGHEVSSDSQVLQSFTVAQKSGFAIFNSALWPRPDGAIVYFWPFGEALSAYRMVNGVFQSAPVSAKSTATNALPFSGMTVSSNGSVRGSGILWVTTVTSRPVPAPGVLRAFDAGNVAIELWNSDMSGGRDTLGSFSKFANPTVANGKVYVPTQSGQVVAYGLMDVPGVAAVVNAASFHSAVVAPGELATIFGAGLGPDAPLVAATPSKDAYPTNLGGSQVFFDEVPAPLLYVSSDQLNVIVPYSLAGRGITTMHVISPSGPLLPYTLPVNSVAPGLFSQDTSGTGQGAILNQADGSENSPANPVERGANIVLYATGTGVTSPRSLDGTISSRSGPPAVAQPVAVLIGGTAAEVISQTAAPGSVAGVTQIIARVPAGIQPGPAVPLIIFVGSTPSQNTVTLAVK